ncbi:hypothetical protein DW049_13995 [Ruminococcus sp. AF41-9]|nr:hypothetical protein DW049_13995 [Ruminococcus sp. AF41-9]
MVGEPDTAVIFLNVWGNRDTDAGKRTRRKIVSFVCGYWIIKRIVRKKWILLLWICNGER